MDRPRAESQPMHVDDKLWEIANYVTGFAVAQTIATSFAIAKRDWPVLRNLCAGA